MKDRIVVAGNGWLGNRLAEALGGTVVDFDITDWAAVAETLREERPTVLVNAAGKTGKPNVDSCEDDPVGTLLSNVAGPLILARECLSQNVYLAHLGSGCVYSGVNPENHGWNNGWLEDDEPNFKGSLYSRSKAMSEAALRTMPVLQLRLRMPFDGTPHPRNLITKLASYPKVVSVPNSLTYVDDLLEAARILIERRKTGIWNVVNPGTVTHPQLLDLYREAVDPDHTYGVISEDDLARTVRAGRSHCVLSTAKLEREGVMLRPVLAALDEAMRRYREGRVAS